MPAKTNAFLANLPLAHAALLQWYGAQGRRHLPWRNTRDAYAIYISEIMLQQTQVKTVLDRFYEPFLKRFPTLAALGSAHPQEVVKAWEGLGYYSRARNLHEAARRSGGALPRTVEGLLALPGIGRNTAHAVACFAFGAALPVMEANVKRVIYRVFALKEAGPEELFAKAAQLLDPANPYDYNQAMMDVGALVCTPRKPRCRECPLSVICRGKVNPEAYPAAKKAKATPQRAHTIVAFRGEDGAYHLTRRETRFLGGLYGFMEYEAGATEVTFQGKRHPLTQDRLLGQVRQVYSHFMLEAQVYVLTLPTGVKPAPESVAVTLAGMRELPLSKADHKIAALLAVWEEMLGGESPKIHV